MAMFVQFSELSTWKLMDANQNTSLFRFVLNAAPSESMWRRFTTNHRTGFTDEMQMNIACD